MSRIVTILQARVSSSRLPGKVLMPILGQPMLARQIERVRRAAHIGHLIVATSTGPDDDALAALCQSIGVECFRGALDDVLDRYHAAALPHEPDHVVRLTGDCPLADPAVIDRIIATHLENGSDFTSNTLSATYPDGLDVEVFRFTGLAEAWQEARMASEREHVTAFLKNRPERYRLANVTNPVDLSALRWTVDETEDFEFVRQVYEDLYPRNAAFTMDGVLALLTQRPELVRLNAHHIRNAGYQKSLAEDREIV